MPCSVVLHVWVPNPPLATATEVVVVLDHVYSDFVRGSVLKHKGKMIDHVLQWTFVFLAPRNEDRQSSISPVPATASQGLNI